MVLRIGTNTLALGAARRLSDAISSVSTSYERLSSGARINRASDDAAGLAVSASLHADTRVYGQGVRNINDGLSLLNIGQGALTELSSITIRQQELAEQAANGVYSLAQRKALDAEANALVDEFNRIVESVSFNGLRLFDGTLTQGLRIQTAYGLDGGIGFNIGEELQRPVGDGTYTTSISFAITSPGSTGVFDLNGDGASDIVVGTGGQGLHVMLGNGNGTFKAKQAYSHPYASTYSIKAGDVNGDGKIDIVGSENASDVITIHLGNGDGSLRNVTTWAAGNEPTSVELFDFNRDGRLDIEVFNFLDDNVSILLGNGNGSFSAPVSYRGLDGFEARVTDINGDGLADIITASSAASEARVMLGNGDGSFRSYTAFRSSAPQSIETGDFNHDGLTDLVLGSALGSFDILAGNGDGSFKARVSFRSVTGGVFSRQEIVDANSDGELDIHSYAYQGGGAGNAILHLGNGNGTFRAGESANRGTSTISSKFGDFTGDGVADLLVADKPSNRVSLYSR